MKDDVPTSLDAPEGPARSEATQGGSIIVDWLLRLLAVAVIVTVFVALVGFEVEKIVQA